MNTQILIDPLTSPICKDITIPGSKSITNRALIMAALTDGAVALKNSLMSDDTEAMIECLQTLGIEIKVEKNCINVLGSIKDVVDKNYNLNARLSGTTIRFILALSVLIPGIKKLQGVGRLNERPIRGLVDGLRQLGAEIQYTNKEGFPPLEIRHDKVHSDRIAMEGNVSSQYFTAVLLIAPYLGGLEIKVIGEQISKSYIDITIQMMREWGVEVTNNSYESYNVPKGGYHIQEYTVEGDYSAAGYFAAIAVLTKSKITLKNVKQNSTQGDKQFLEILKDMGNEVVYHDNEVTIAGKNTVPVDVSMEECPDQAQTLAVLAAFADGVTTIRGVRSLRVKETERVKAVQAELAKMGIRTESPDEDTLIVHGGAPKSATIDTYDDHRMAMSFAVVGAKLEGMKINNPGVVKKTFPDFWKTLKKIGVEVKI